MRAAALKPLDAEPEGFGAGAGAWPGIDTGAARHVASRQNSRTAGGPMKKSSQKQSPKDAAERPVLDSSRKPVAPPGHPLTRAKPEERAHPAERKVKHKHRPGEGE